MGGEGKRREKEGRIGDRRVGSFVGIFLKACAYVDRHMIPDAERTRVNITCRLNAVTVPNIS